MNQENKELKDLKDNHFKEVMISLGLEGNVYQEKIIKNYYNTIINYMLDAGVSKDHVYQEYTIGVVSNGVTDLWNYDGGEGKLSGSFTMMVNQLREK